MPITVTLPQNLEAFIQRQVSSGRYATPGEVILEGLDRLDVEDRFCTENADDLRQAINAGLQSGPATAWDPEEIKNEGRRLRDAPE